MDLFDKLAQGDIEALRTALAADPVAAAVRNATGASLLMWTRYVGNADATALVRAALPHLDPYEAIVVGDDATLTAALASGWDGNALSPDGFTPLALATFFASRGAFDVLLPLTRDVNQQANNAQRVAALHAATASRQAGMVERLLRAGAKPDLTQADGFTPLHAAAHNGDATIAGLLLLFGATPGLANAKGQTAADIAQSAGHNWLATLLRSAQ